MRKIIVYVAMLLSIIAYLPMGERIVPASVNRNAAPTVIVDAGHGGIDGGAVGVSGAMEKDLNLDIAVKTDALLRLLGFNTAMTREVDMSIHDGDARSIRDKKISDMKKRVQMVNDTPNARLISIHMNHFSGADCRGAQVFYAKGYSTFAECVQQMFKEGLGSARAAKEAQKNVYLMTHVDCPAILVECGFLSNPLEERKLLDLEYQKRVALCIAVGYAHAEKTGM